MGQAVRSANPAGVELRKRDGEGDDAGDATNKIGARDYPELRCYFIEAFCRKFGQVN
jgi:hypothetical protein